ncbi:TonB-dependent receptor [Marivirga sp.]|uniref:TonB-dependent receptor domain-containing protein n=1 Tax=Marivirga sp. TaxID=2018662 RepID=UPI0025CC22F2|nr:TonB-dependent receptor [Marivirga sp.]
MKSLIKIFGLLITILLLTIQFTQAQNKITGSVKDSEANPLPFSNVVLIQPNDSALVKGTVSEADGSFEIKNIDNGNYILQTLMIGYQPSSQTVEVTNQNSSLALNIIMNEDTQSLDEVVVKAQKPLYEKKADRTVVNVQSQITSSSKSVLDVLARSPGVIVNQQNNSISMFGQNGVGIMINGKLSQLPIEAVVQMLNGMNASNVEKIELITSPPVKYDAEGVGGLINIVTKKTPNMGTNGIAALTAGYNQGKILAGNLSLNHRQDRINYFIEYGNRTDDNNQLWLENRTLFGDNFDQTIDIKQDRAFNLTEQNLRAGFSYDLTDKTTVNLLATGHKRNWYMDATANNINRAAPDSTVITTMELNESNIWMDAMIGLGIEHRFNRQHSLDAHFDYLYFVNDNPSNYDIATQINNAIVSESTLKVTKDTPVNFKVSKIDYTNLLSDKFKLQAGAKASLSELENNVIVTDFEQEQWMINNRFTSLAKLKEDVWAGYVSLDWSISDKLKIYSGLRYEFTSTYLSEGVNEGLVDREYGNFFPNFSISNKLAEESTVSLAYSRRITRPSFNEIAPFVFFSGPNTFFAGNPALFPAITDGLDLSYQLKSWWISLKYNTTDNQIQRFQPATNPETGEQIYSSQNMDYFNSWVITSSLPIFITSWWEIQNDISLNHQSFKTHNGFIDKGFTWNANSTLTFSLPKDFTIEASGNYFSEQFMGLWKSQPYGQVDLAIKKAFEKSSLSFSFIDVFDTFNPIDIDGSILNGQGNSHVNLDLNIQSVNITYTKTFGNNKLKSVNLNSGSEDERRRVN